MNRLFLTVFLLTSLQTFAQFDYELFKSYSDKTTQERNKKLINVTEYQKDKELWIKTSLQQFNSAGLSTTLIQYDQQGKEVQKKNSFMIQLDVLQKLKATKMEHMKKQRSLI